jgi:hypothetical protein
MSAGPSSIAATTFSSGYALSSRQRKGLGGANGLSNVGAKLGCRKLAAILRWLRDAYHGPPGPCSDAAGAIETTQRYGSDHQYREIVNSRLEEHRLGAPRVAFGARSLPPSFGRWHNDCRYAAP